MSVLQTHAWFTGSVHSFGSISASLGFSGSFSGDGSGLTGLVIDGSISSSGQIDHNQTANYTASRHIDHNTVEINGINGLTGGGSITTTRTISLDTNSSTFSDGVKAYAYYSSSISGNNLTLFKSSGGNHTLDITNTNFSQSIAGRVEDLEQFSSSLNATFATDGDLSQLSSSLQSRVTDLELFSSSLNVPTTGSFLIDATSGNDFITFTKGDNTTFNISILNSSSLGLNTKVGHILSSSYQPTGSVFTQTVSFATPFSSSNYSISLNAIGVPRVEVFASEFLPKIHNKTAAGFDITTSNDASSLSLNLSYDYIAVAYGETAVTSSFTELANTASYAITASYALNAGGVTSYTELSNIPANIVSSSIQISALGFLTSSSLGLSTKAGSIPSSSFLASGSATVAEVTFATPFSSSNYSVVVEFNDDTYSISTPGGTQAFGLPLIKSKTSTGFEIESPFAQSSWALRPGSSYNYIAVAYGETAVTSSFTELASTASYILGSNVDGAVSNSTSSSYAITASYALNAGGVTSYAELTGIPANIISSSIQISSLGFLTSSSLGLNTKVGNIPSSSFQNTGSDSYADVVFATPFSSSNYSVALQLNSNIYFGVDNFLIQNKSTTGFRIVNDFTVQQVWSISPNSSVDYIAVAHGETAVTSSFTELASTASYVDFSNVANLPTLISGSAQIAGDISGSLGANATLIRSLTASSISGSFTSLSGSIAANIAANASSVGYLNAASSSYLLNTTDTLTGNLTVTGTITAQEFHTEFVSASIIFQSGSTKFGNSVDDTHQFTGSVLVKGDLLPGLNEQYDLGSASNRWKDLYLSGSTIYLGDAQISEASWNAVSSSSTYTYTLPAATSTVRGGIELFSNTVQSVAANAVSTTAGRTYGVQVNSDGQAVVNIPWTDTDTNTTYSISAETVTGGANLRLTDSGAGTDDVAIKGSGATTVTRTDANTITISSTDTNTNTTYSISAETATGGANLRLTDSGAGTDDVKLAGGTNVTVTRTDANTITISSTDTTNTYTAGNGLELTGNAFSLNTGSAHFISGSRESFSAGTNVSITNGVISSTDTKVTVNNNTNNYVLTGTGTADTINGESTFTYDGSKLKVSPSGNGYTEIGIDAQIGTQNNPFLRFTHTIAAPSVGITLGRLEFSGSDNSTSTSDGIRAYVSAEYEGLLGGTALVFGVADNNASIAVEGMRLHQDSNLEVVGEVTAANFITTSDRRLKADITPIQEGLETIKKFVSYEYTKNGLKEAGFIAQEVQEALPYAVREGEDGFLRMTDRAILAHMHKAILELEQKIKEIENKL